ncbi:unnamed protein product [Polarella glacialis]|uniref:Uncharacterized protein n=1 Tax=Polarella glacialis TaxID=89957 RepID=A0A813D7F2_POLGL|nr:unnamed protein product [Polarella glacialis]
MAQCVCPALQARQTGDHLFSHRYNICHIRGGEIKQTDNHPPCSSNNNHNHNNNNNSNNNNHNHNNHNSNNNNSSVFVLSRGKGRGWAGDKTHVISPAKKKRSPNICGRFLEAEFKDCL